MGNKIGIFLMIVLVIWSILLLDATKNRVPLQPAAQPVESTGTHSELSAPETMPPETTAPATAPANTPDLSRVEAVLNRHTANRTAVTHLVRVGEAGDSQTGALAELVSRRKMNPIAAFWLLVSEGLYERDGKSSGLPLYELHEIPTQSVKQYPYTDAGTEQLLTDLLTLAGQMADDLELEQAILGTDGAADPGQVFLSEREDCYYAYFARTGDRSTQILCFYIRGDAQITDVEWQLLHMTDSSDPEEGNGQAASLAAAAELLLTGTCRAGTGKNAASYEVGIYKAEAEQFFFTSEEEQGSLTNYRLRK